MLTKSNMKCDACAMEFQATLQHAQYFCNKCNKHFTLCPKCRKTVKCNYCGSSELIDVYEHHKKTTGSYIMF